MKKFLAGLLALFVFTIALPLSAEAQRSCYRSKRAKNTYYSRNYRAAQQRNYRSYRTQPRYANYRNYRNANYRTYRTAGYSYQRPSFYRRHRNLINLGIATGGGAIIGGLAGGRKGAGVGALVGAGAGALYTYVLNKKKRRY